MYWLSVFRFQQKPFAEDRSSLRFSTTSTWYKYTKLLKIFRPRPLSRRKNHDMGIRADAPHKIWHMDITEFKTMDNGKAYIHILIDNFSRYILGFRVSLHKKAQNTLDVLQDDYNSFIVPMIKDNPDLLLLSDSGSENKAKIVQDFIKQESNYLTHLKTIVDIEYSNNMIEAYNKTLKYRFLYTRNLPDFNALEKYLPQAIQEYNEVRPHLAIFNMK